MPNEVETFFDSIASSWDEKECHTTSEKRYLLDLINLKEGDEVLDIACGTGVISELIHEYTNSNVFGIDISKNMIEIAQKKYKDKKWASFKHVDLMELDEEKKYDVAIIYNAYPHFLSPEALSNKLAKILKKNGKFAIIHSLSRYELSAHHSGSASKVSRDLNSPELESNFFKNNFNIIVCNEEEHTFELIGTLK